MFPGSTIIACLLLAVNRGAPEAWPMNSAKFAIPITIKQERQAEIRELILYVSRDGGNTWEVGGRATPDQKQFPYHAPADGVYWFSVAVINQKNQQEPAQITNKDVGQKIIVDTKKPDIQAFTAERQGDHLVVRWAIAEENPDPTSLKVEYHSADQPPTQWFPAPINPGPEGEVRIGPVSPAAVSLRVQMQDIAGNRAEMAYEVPAATSANVVSTPGGGWSGGRSDTLYRNMQPVDPGTHESFPIPNVPMGVGPAPAPCLPPPVPPQFSQPNPPVGIYGTASNIPVVVATGGSQQIYPNSPGQGGGYPTITSTGANYPGNSRPLPRLQITNQRQVALDFEVAKSGPSGVGSVDVYLTTDEGLTWVKEPVAAGMVTLPPPGQPHGPNGSPHGNVVIQLPKDEVTYGIYLVIKSGAGLGQAPPRNGMDIPQIRIEVDTKPPVAQLLQPQNDPNRNDTLVLSWLATDRNMADNPITLEWAERPEGPWQLIGSAELPNTGRIAWVITTGMPHSVYLKLTTRDRAGNAAVAQTREPVMIDLTTPVLGNVTMSLPNAAGH